MKWDCLNSTISKIISIKPVERIEFEISNPEYYSDFIGNFGLARQ